MTVKTYSAAYDYPITTPNGTVVNPTNGRCWFTSKERMQKLIEDGRVYFGADGGNTPRLKRYLADVQQGMTPTTIWKCDDVGHNQEGRQKLFVSELQYTTTIGRQKANMNEYEIDRGDSFTGEKTRTQTLKHAETSQIKYDLIGKIADGAKLTRKSASAILQGIRADKLYMFKNNPEEFISKVIRLVNEQKATMIVEHISYNTIEGEYDSSIFTAEKATQSFDKAFLAKKAIQDYVFTDGSAEKSIERKFAEDLDAAEEVCVYAKLPRTFQIPTPVGNYSPDWAIAFYAGTVKHIFFVAETKGTMKTLELRPIEQAKISCAKKLFNEMSTSHVVYHDVDSYQSLLNIMNSI